MATLNELGRNSAALSYGPSTTGADLWPTLAALDGWIRNDTLQGTVTCSGTTVTGVGTAFTTQVEAGFVIMIAGVPKTVASVTSDTALEVTIAYTTATVIASAVKVLNTTNNLLTGITTATNATFQVRGATNGRVYCVAGSQQITGIGTFFLSDCTNSVTLQAVTGTVAIDTSGNVTGSATSFVAQQGAQNGLFPGDSIAVTLNGRTQYFIINTVTGDGAATLVTPPATAIAAGATIAKAQNGVIGRKIQINGRLRTVTGISSNSIMTVNAPMDFTDSNLRYKTFPRGTISNGTNATTQWTFTALSTGTNRMQVTAPSAFISVGATIYNIWQGTVALTAGTLISAQEFGGLGTAITQSPINAELGTSTISVSSSTSIVVGQLISGNGAPLLGIQTGTYVTGIVGNSATISSTVTTAIVAQQGFFYTPGGAGTYLTTQPTTIATSATTVSAVQGTGTNFLWDLQTGDQVWIGDELRTLNFNTLTGTLSSSIPTAATNYGYTTDYAGYSGVATHVLRQTYFGSSFKRDETYITMSASPATISNVVQTEIRQGDDLIIDGTEVTIAQVVNTSTTAFRLTQDFTHTPNALQVYKKRKLHGFVLEGTREGGPGLSFNGLSTATQGIKWSQLASITATTSVLYDIGATQILVSAVPFTNTALPNHFIKISGAGGAPIALTGQINSAVATTTLTGLNTQFTTQLHIGAEIIIAGQHLVVIAINSDTSMVVHAAVTVIGPTPFYRSVPLYTYIAAIAGNLITLGTPIRHPVYSTGVAANNPPLVFFMAHSADFIEYVYSAPNKSADAVPLINTSNDRKYFGIRYWPLLSNTQVLTTGTGTIAAATAGIATPVYERWAAAYGGAHGVGVNMSDMSGGTMVVGTQTTTAFTVGSPITGSITTSMQAQGTAGNSITALTSAQGTQGLANSAYTMSQSYGSGLGATTVFGLNGVFDIQSLTQTTGGYLYLFANPRYFVLQGKSYSNIQTQWQGVIEFERAQPEDTGSGLGTSAGIVYSTLGGGTQLAQGFSGAPTNTTAAGFSQSIQYLPGIAPWPCFAYFNSNRFPVGSAQNATLPVASLYPIHGGIFATPRVRNSVGDLVGINAHIYSAATITTGRWGHVVEFGATGSYTSPGTLANNALPAQPTNTVPQIHMGQIVPVYTNVYNSKRFMFSPVVVLGPAYDPDIRGRIYGLKVLPSALGTLMDTVSITVDSNSFYDSTQSAKDHWVIGTPPTAGALSGQQTVVTYRFTTLQNATTGPQQSWRSLEDTNTQGTSGAPSTFVNNFRWALPA